MLSGAPVFFWPESVHTRELMWGVVWWVQCGDFGVCFLMRFQVEIRHGTRNFRVYHLKKLKWSAASLVWGNVGAQMILWR
jgi:hypothetical protein